MASPLLITIIPLLIKNNKLIVQLISNIARWMVFVSKQTDANGYKENEHTVKLKKKYNLETAST